MKKVLLFLLLVSIVLPLSTKIKGVPFELEGDGGGSIVDSCDDSNIYVNSTKSCKFESTNDVDYLTLNTPSYNFQYKIYINVSNSDIDSINVYDEDWNSIFSKSVDGTYTISLDSSTTYKIRVQGDNADYSIKVYTIDTCGSLDNPTRIYKDIALECASETYNDKDAFVFDSNENALMTVLIITAFETPDVDVYRFDGNKIESTTKVNYIAGFKFTYVQFGVKEGSTHYIEYGGLSAGRPVTIGITKSLTLEHAWMADLTGLALFDESTGDHQVQFDETGTGAAVTKYVPSPHYDSDFNFVTHTSWEINWEDEDDITGLDESTRVYLDLSLTDNSIYVVTNDGYVETVKSWHAAFYYYPYGGPNKTSHITNVKEIISLDTEKADYFYERLHVAKVAKEDPDTSQNQLLMYAIKKVPGMSTYFDIQELLLDLTDTSEYNPIVNATSDYSSNKISVGEDDLDMHDTSDENPNDYSIPRVAAFGTTDKVFLSTSKMENEANYHHVRLEMYLNDILSDSSYSVAGYSSTKDRQVTYYVSFDIVGPRGWTVANIVFEKQVTYNRSN